MKNTEMFTRMSNVLLALKRQNALGFNLGEFINKIDAPYKNNLLNVLVNIGAVEYVSRGKYKPTDFEVNDYNITQVIIACRAATKGKPRKENEEVKMEQKPAIKVIERPTNPFGMDSFSTIMVEKGSIRIGDYLLEGNFTVTKVKDNGTDTTSSE